MRSVNKKVNGINKHVKIVVLAPKYTQHYKMMI